MKRYANLNVKKELIFTLTIFILLLFSISFKHNESKICYAEELSDESNEEIEKPLPFTDVKKGAWYYESLSTLYNNNVIDGYNDNTFRPNVEVTKGQIIKLLVMIVNENFEAVPDKTFWLNPYTTYAKNVGLIDEIESTQVYNSPITREEVAYYSYRALNVQKGINDIYNDSVQDKSKINQITDNAAINEKYKDSVLNLYGMEIFSGYSDNSFKPKNKLTRAELTIIISKLRAKRMKDILRNKINLEQLLGYFD